MADTIRVSSASGSHTISLKAVDSRILGIVTRRLRAEAQEPIGRIFNWAPEERTKLLPPTALVDVMLPVLRELERDRELLSFAYTHSCQITDSSGNVFQTSGMGGTHGFRLAGDEDHPCGLNSNIGICELTRWSTDERGQGVIIEVRDCRGLKSLETANMGVIKIGRRRVKFSLIEELGGLIEFARGETDAFLRFAHTSGAEHPRAR